MSLSQDDQDYLQRAIEISRRALEHEGKTPFGALVVVDGEIAGEGTSSVIELIDPTAHAEVMAIRNAATTLRRHLMEDGTLYSSSEPCPMCLAACYWARVPRVVFGATSSDVATYGFEDLQLYREMSCSADQRTLREEQAGEQLRRQAADVLRRWAEQLPETVVPKFLPRTRYVLWAWSATIQPGRASNGHDGHPKLLASGPSMPSLLLSLKELRRWRLFGKAANLALDNQHEGDGRSTYNLPLKRAAMYRIGLAGFLAFSVILLSFINSSSASACGPATGNHCYAEAAMIHSAYSYQGEQATIRPHCLYTSVTGNGNFVSQEMWLVTDNSISSQYWVETGAIADGSDPNNQYRWFWANYYPGATQIYVHYNGPGVSMDTNYTAQILYFGQNQWAVLVEVDGGGFTQYGTALYNPPYSSEMIAGTEYTASNDRDNAKETSLKYQRLDNSWGGWWGDTPAQNSGPGHYVTATMPSDTEVDWATC